MSKSTSREGEQFPHVLAFRLDVAGKHELELAAAARGLTTGAMARRLVKAGLKSEMRIPSVRKAVANAAELRQLLGAVGKIGSNLNQIARALNSSTSAATLSTHLERLRTIEAEAMAIRELVVAALKGGQ